MDEQIEMRIQRVQATLDAVARECLRTISSKDITLEEGRKLAKFLFGCMNQKFELRERIANRGVGEVDKIVEFMIRAHETWQAVEMRLAGEQREHA